MNIHEYQAKEVLKTYGLKTLKGSIAKSPEEALKVAETIGGSSWVLKAQVHAGGRGKGGGVKLVSSKEELVETAKKMIGMKLVTNQTGPNGKVVHQILVEESCNILNEYYVALLIDRPSGRVAMIASSEGGMDIEEVAHKTPDKLHKVLIDPSLGLAPFQARSLAFSFLSDFSKTSPFSETVKSLIRLYKVFTDKDCSLLEINPLVQTKENELIVLDAKMDFDSNALYRQKQIVGYRDIKEEDEVEAEASQKGLAFIKLNGNIGCLVNGAGLAMATMDVIKLYGGEPANFLDVGGGANQEKVTTAFEFILRDPNVRGLLVNIFGGIMRCDIVAKGLVSAFKKVNIKVPLVVRLEGTNKEEGQKVLAESKLNIIPASRLSEAAKKIVSAINKNKNT